MATSKHKPASPAKKKAGAVKSGAMKKPAKKPTTAAKKPVSGKIVKKPAKAAPASKKAIRKPVKTASKPAAKKAVPAKKAVARKKAVVKPQWPARKLLAANKRAPKKAVVKPVRQIKPPSKAVKKKSHPPKQATSSKGNMSVVTPVSDTITREDGRYALPSTVNIELSRNYRPTIKEEYMAPRQLAYFRAKLQGWRKDLVEESKQTIDNLRDEVRDVGDEAERATRETENSLELRTRDRYRKLIAKIDKALKRIEEGRYGYCEETDEEIGLERLEARPIATLSLDAQERWEHRQKQMGD
jgi:DnaK suppressor protein